MKTGKLNARKIKLVMKNYDENWNKLPTSYIYAERGEVVHWDGGSNEGHEDSYGGRRVLWCKLWSGEDIGLTEEEVDWDE